MENLSTGLLNKLNKSYKKLFIEGILCTFVFSMACIIAMSVSTLTQNAITSKLLFSALFPIGLMLIVSNGYELFTGDTMMLLYVKEQPKKVILSLITVYIANFLGSMLVCYLVYLTGLLDTYLIDAKLISAYTAKTSMSILKMFVLGIFCNIMVCMAVYLSMKGRTFGEKCLYIFFPLFTFVFMGFEHCIANMTYLPLAILSGGLDIAPALVNLLFVTLGNILGGFLFAYSVHYRAKIK